MFILEGRLAISPLVSRQAFLVDLNASIKVAKCISSLYFVVGMAS